MPSSVVLADDRPENRGLVRAYLTLTFGVAVVVAGEASDGHEAVQRCADLQPDVVVLDDDMPSLTGTAAIAALRRVAPDTFIILYSASAADVRALHAPDRHVDKTAGLQPLGLALAAGFDAAAARAARRRRAASG
jgi:CheY-like chemotaxis protein